MRIDSHMRNERAPAAPAVDALLSPRRRLLLQGLAAAALAAGCGERAAAPVAARFGGPTMGSTYTVKIAGAPLTAAAEAAARRAVEAAFAGVVARMSTYDDGSELSRFNRHAGPAPFPLSADTLAVLALAQEVSAATGGAFDVTVAPAVDAWGFGPVKSARVVTGGELAALAPRMGWRMLAVDARTGTATKARADLRVDLSGIAKGFAVDAAAAALDAQGYADYMVEAGGEVRTRGRNAAGQPWQIAIERPDATPQRAHRIVPLSGLALATSGDYRIYFERDGARYCHEIDPATGRPVAHGLASVSVAARDCGYADAMATALFVLGPERGVALAQRHDVAAHFIVRDGRGGFRDVPTAAFAALGAVAA
ncbi:MAG: FAD:protein FMN transferase [Betaproteobacteria bacterium]|nr:FAD:protein FMN transferase [Betaproteobacteria bacterium]